MEDDVPGDHRINFRASKEDIELIRQAAAITKRSMVSFGMAVMLHAANNVLAGSSELVPTSSPAPQAKPSTGHADPGPRDVAPARVIPQTHVLIGDTLILKSQEAAYRRDFLGEGGPVDRDDDMSMMIRKHF